MPDASLLKKLGIKPSTSIRLLNMPENLGEKLVGDGETASATILFVHSVVDVEQQLPDVIEKLPAGQLMWIGFPKKTSSIKTDISRDIGWETVKNLGYRTVNLIAIDDDWSAFRIQPIGTHVSLGRRDRSEPRPELIVPEPLVERFGNAPEAEVIFDKLSYTCRKEYIRWIESAKRPETVLKRLNGTIEMLSAGVKTPTG
jgi:hypothetical protein